MRAGIVSESWAPKSTVKILDVDFRQLGQLLGQVIAVLANAG
jgi:hypothetical protein